MVYIFIVSAIGIIGGTGNALGDVYLCINQLFWMTCADDL